MPTVHHQVPARRAAAAKVTKSLSNPKARPAPQPLDVSAAAEEHAHDDSAWVRKAIEAESPYLKQVVRDMLHLQLPRLHLHRGACPLLPTLLPPPTQ